MGSTIVAAVSGLVGVVVGFILNEISLRFGTVKLSYIPDEYLGLDSNFTKVSSSTSFILDVINRKRLPISITSVEIGTEKNGKRKVHRIVANGLTQDPLNIDALSARRIVLDAKSDIKGMNLYVGINGRKPKRVSLMDSEQNYFSKFREKLIMILRLNKQQK